MLAFAYDGNHNIIIYSNLDSLGLANLYEFRFVRSRETIEEVYTVAVQPCRKRTIAGTRNDNINYSII